MATLIKLGNRPKTFKPFDVKFIGAEGEELTIPGVAFKYRTRSEYGALIDSHSVREAYKPAADEKFSVEKLLAAVGTNTTALVLDAVQSWSIDLPVEKATVEQMLDEEPASIAALIEAYAAAARDGRLGNS